VKWRLVKHTGEQIKQERRG